FMDHIAGNMFAVITIHNYALSDATEIFVLLAGYGAGLAYGRAMDRHGWVYAAADTLKRAWTLYIAHIFLFVVFSTQVSYSAAALDRANYLDELHLDVLADAPYRALLKALMLGYQPAYLDILPMYIALLILFAFALPLLRRPALLAALSFAMYAFARLSEANLPSWTADGWYFNPLTWQFLFMLGAILSYAPPGLPRHKRWLDVLAGLVIVTGIAIQWIIWPNPAVAASLPLSLARLLLEVDKQGLHPFRLINMLAFTWVVIRCVPASAAWLRSRWAAPVALAGQHSLPVFCTGIFLSFLGRIVLETNRAWPVQLAVNVAGTVVLVAVGALAAWYREKGRPPAPARPAGGATAV
nr:OpgC domain-containing protein [Pseudomonadota bacterium]